MNNQQALNFFNEVYLIYSAYSFAKDPSLLQAASQTTPFSLAVSDHFSSDSRNNDETDQLSFQTRLQPSIILQSSTFIPLKIAPLKVIPKYAQPKQPSAKKPVQKDSRNVSSNLLRIFLKNVIELRVYDETIQKVIGKMDISATCQSFHEWLQSFGINFKNYIRFTQFRRLYMGQERPEMHAIFRALFRMYVKELGVCHTLTSRRIQRASNFMHLSGLRNMPHDLTII